MSDANFIILALNTPSYIALLYTVITMATIVMVATINTNVRCNVNQSVTVTTIKLY